MKEIRILLNYPMFTNLCKMGFYNEENISERIQLYFTKEDIRLLINGKVVEKESSYTNTNYMFMLQDIGFENINEILKRSPIFSDLVGNLNKQ